MFDNIFIWAQIIGFIAVAMNAMIGQIKEPKHIIIAYIPTNFIWAIQFFMVGGLIGATVSIAYIFRDSCFVFLKKKHHKYVVCLMLVFVGLIGFYQYKEIFDILPLIAMTVFNIGFFFKEKRPIWARCSLINSICYLIYCTHIVSIPGAISCMFCMSSNLIGMYRYEEWNLKSSPKRFLQCLFIIHKAQTKEPAYV